MSENPHGHLADIARGRLQTPKAFADQHLHTALMGDCHLSNFSFITESGAAGDWVVFVPNDFDDACDGPAVWDIVRFAVSLVLGAEFCRGIVEGRYQPEEVSDAGELAAPADAETAVRAFITAYRETCAAIVQDPGRLAPVAGDAEAFRGGVIDTANRQLRAAGRFAQPDETSVSRNSAMHPHPL